MAHLASLREGDRLTAAVFMRRWEAMPELKRAELIDGVVFCSDAPVMLSHGTAHSQMAFWLSTYMETTPGCVAGINATWLMGPADVSQPDVYFRIQSDYGGQSGETGDYCAGAPELVVEVTDSVMSRDLGVKLELYRRVGVREYITVLLNPRQVIWRQLVRGRHREIASGEDGLLRSHAFPGLWLDPEAFWSKKKSIRKAVELGMKSAEHAAFVKRLASAHRRRK